MIMSNAQVNSFTTCPVCGSNAVQKTQSSKMVSTSGDRLCQDCSATWSPPVSGKISLVIGILCALLAAFALVGATQVGQFPMSLILIVGGIGFGIGAFAGFRLAAKGGTPLEIHQPQGER